MDKQRIYVEAGTVITISYVNQNVRKLAGVKYYTVYRNNIVFTMSNKREVLVSLYQLDDIVFEPGGAGK